MRTDKDAKRPATYGTTKEIEAKKSKQDKKRHASILNSLVSGRSSSEALNNLYDNNLTNVQPDIYSTSPSRVPPSPIKKLNLSK